VANVRRRPDFQFRPEHGKWPSGMQHNFDRGSDSDFRDPGGWNKASYTPDLLAELEPLPDAVNGYRQAALITTGRLVRFFFLCPVKVPTLGVTTSSELGRRTSRGWRERVLTVMRPAAFRLAPTFIESKPVLDFGNRLAVCWLTLLVREDGCT
jgi:hypothetical protein